LAEENEATGESASPFNVVNSFVDVPTVYADACVFAAAVGSNIRMTFMESILGPTDSPEPGWKVRHVGHLVMPRDGFASTVRYFNLVARQLGISVDDTPE
jgi:hypothetical protein